METVNVQLGGLFTLAVPPARLRMTCVRGQACRHSESRARGYGDCLKETSCCRRLRYDYATTTIVFCSISSCPGHTHQWHDQSNQSFVDTVHSVTDDAEVHVSCECARARDPHCERAEPLDDCTLLCCVSCARGPDTAVRVALCYRCAWPDVPCRPQWMAYSDRCLLVFDFLRS